MVVGEALKQRTTVGGIIIFSKSLHHSVLRTYCNHENCAQKLQLAGELSNEGAVVSD